MKNKFLLTLLPIFVIITVNISCDIQRRSPDTKADVTGKWEVTISIAAGTIMGKGLLSQSGEDVTGWVGPSENDPIPITGMFRSGKLLIRTLPQPGRIVAFDEVELSVDADRM